MARYLTKSSCASPVNNGIHNCLKCILRDECHADGRVQAEERETDHEGRGEKGLVMKNWGMLIFYSLF